MNNNQTGNISFQFILFMGLLPSEWVTFELIMPVTYKLESSNVNILGLLSRKTFAG
jgi:hypothetical protein